MDLAVKTEKVWEISSEETTKLTKRLLPKKNPGIGHDKSRNTNFDSKDLIGLEFLDLSKRQNMPRRFPIKIFPKLV